MTDARTPNDPSEGHGSERHGAEEARLRDLLRGASAPGRAPDAFAAIYAVKAKVRRRKLLRAGVSGCLVAGLAAGLIAAILPGAGDGSPALVAAPAAPGLGPPAHLTGALVSFNGCDDYLSYIRQRAEAMAGPYGLQTVAYSARYGYSGMGGPVVAPAMSGASIGGVPSGVPASGGTTEAGPSVAFGASGAAAGPSSPTLSYSQTNDQVAGVDEPDTVKTDGQVVVTLDGSTLRVLDPAAHVLGSMQLAGDTGGGFLLVGNRALVFSSPPAAVPGTTASADTYPAYYGSGTAAPASPAETAQVAVVDLSHPTSPQLLWTFRFDGSIVAARLVGQQVRLVLRRDGPDLSFATPSPSGDGSSATAANKRLIAGSTLADWLPAWQVQSPDGAMTARQPLTACDAVARPDQASGISTVTVLSLNPQSSTPGAGTSVVGAGDIVYATVDRLYVAGPSADSIGQTPQGQTFGCCSVAPPVGASTRIYAFDTPASGPASFAGEGTVPGWLVNSYAMDEDSAGLLRVASTSESSGTSHSQISVLAPSGGQLATVGSVAGLGAGEFIRAVRFLGDQAYVVTFSTFDPLYVVDLSRPTKPVLTGELDQPGFSEFLYPLPDHRLLGVGVQLTGNEPSGLVVATYDVSDPAHPRRIDVSNLAQGFYSQGYDPHAFLYWPAVNLALIALPGGESTGSSSGVAAYQIGSSGTLSRTATLGHGTESATRSVVIGDQVWVTTPDGVVTSNLTDLPATTWHSY